MAPFGVPLLVNDRVDVALAAGADGVHVGQTDMAPEDARRLLGPKAIIGLSINTVALAEAAPIETLDYVGIGGVYATTSKDQKKPPIGVDGLARIVEVFRRRDPKFPSCAIAGINAANAGATIAAGADGVSVISALSLAPDPTAAANTMRAVVDDALTARKRPRASNDHADRRHHRRLGFRRRRRHPGRPQDLLGIGRLRRERQSPR